MNLKLLLLISATILVCCRCSDGTRLQKRVSDLLHTEIITRGDLALTQEPVTITSFVAERSAGGVHDFIRKVITGGLIRLIRTVPISGVTGKRIRRTLLLIAMQ